MNTPAKKRKPVAWTDNLYLEVYELAAQGFTDTRVRKALGVGQALWAKWLALRPALREALARARAHESGPPAAQWNGCGERFLDYCYKRLPPELQEFWDTIEDWTAEDEGGKAREPDCWRKIDALFSAPGMTRARQSLFVHALVAANFNANEACRKVCVGYSTVRQWCADPKFKELLKSIEWMKDNMAEAGLFRGIARDEPALITFALRGRMPQKYNPKVSVQHSGNVAHAHFDADKLLESVSVGARREMLAAIRKQQAALPAGEVIDAEDVLP